MLPAPARPIKSVSQPVYNDGNPIVTLSPSGSARNIQIVYQALQHCDPKQRLRAGYTWNGQPYIAFVSKPKYFAGTLKTHNIRQQRQELMNILANVSDVGLQVLTNLRSAEKTGIKAFKGSMQSRAAGSDLRVRDVLQALELLSQRYESLQSGTQAARERRGRLSASPVERRHFTEQRVAQFLNADPAIKAALCEALSLPEDRGQAVAQAAFAAVTRLLSDAHQKGETASHVAKVATRDRELQTFALRWTALRHPRNTDGSPRHIPFGQHAWSLTLDRLAALIMKSAGLQQAHAQQVAQGPRSVGLSPVQVNSPAHLHTVSGASGKANRPSDISSSASGTESSLVRSSPARPQRLQARPSPAPSPSMIYLRKNAAPGPQATQTGSPARQTSPGFRSVTLRGVTKPGSPQPRNAQRFSLSPERIGGLLSVSSGKRFFAALSPKRDFLSRADIHSILEGSPSIEWLYESPGYSSRASLATKGPVSQPAPREPLPQLEQVGKSSPGVGVTVDAEPTGLPTPGDAMS